MTEEKHTLYAHRSKESIISELQAMQARGIIMSYNGINAEDANLYYAARRQFGSLSLALEAAGVEQQFEPRPAKWSADRVKAEIKSLHDAGGDVSAGTNQKHNSPLFSAGIKYFGSWKDAIEAAGINYSNVKAASYKRLIAPTPVKKWSKEKIISEIQSLHERGEDISSGAVQRDHKPLFAIAIRYFGTWEAAVELAGIDYSSIMHRHKSYTKEEILTELRQVYEAGEPIHASHLRKTHSSLAQAIMNRWGSHDTALLLIGLDPKAIRKR